MKANNSISRDNFELRALTENISVHQSKNIDSKIFETLASVLVELHFNHIRQEPIAKKEAA